MSKILFATVTLQIVIYKLAIALEQILWFTKVYGTIGREIW